jgi:hypothetical protein
MHQHCTHTPGEFVRMFRSCLTPQDSLSVNANFAMAAWGRELDSGSYFWSARRSRDVGVSATGTKISPAPARTVIPGDGWHYDTANRLIQHHSEMREITVAHIDGDPYDLTQTGRYSQTCMFT